MLFNMSKFLPATRILFQRHPRQNKSAQLRGLSTFNVRVSFYNFVDLIEPPHIKTDAFSLFTYSVLVRSPLFPLFNSYVIRPFSTTTRCSPAVCLGVCFVRALISFSCYEPFCTNVAFYIVSSMAFSLSDASRLTADFAYQLPRIARLSRRTVRFRISTPTSFGTSTLFPLLERRPRKSSSEYLP